MPDCLFCRIIRKEAPSTILFQDEHLTAFRDLHPAGPVHILIVPNKHIVSVNDLTPGDEPLVGRMFGLARELAAQQGIAEGGYRIISNTGHDGGQTVFHFHLHLIGGQRMRYPMG
jgi:histidine triad (HIT) family protein